MSAQGRPERPPEPRWVQLVHALPGRLRLRVSWLHDAPREAPALAEQVAAHPGVIEARARPFTSSLLIRYDRARADEAGLIEAVRAITGVPRILAAHERPPLPAFEPLAPTIGRELSRFFKELDHELLVRTRGVIDLGTLATIGLIGGGIAKVLISRELPTPPWFHLEWMGYATFVDHEAHIAQEEQQLAADANHGGPPPPHAIR